jgi:hypothetical protein
VELRLLTFIRLDVVVDPLGVRYPADGPGFSHDQRVSKTRHRLMVDPSKVTPSNDLSGREGIGSVDAATVPTRV